MRLSPAARAYYEAAQQECARFDVTTRVEVGGKHAKLIIAHGDRSRFVVFPASPSDAVRGPLNHRRDVRRVIQELNPPLLEANMPNDYVKELEEVKARMTGQPPPQAPAPQSPAKPKAPEPAAPAFRSSVGFADALRVGMNLAKMGVSDAAILEALTHTPDEVCAIAWLRVVDEAAKGAAQVAADEAHDKTVVAIRSPKLEWPEDDPPPNWRSPGGFGVRMPDDVRAWINRRLKEGRTTQKAIAAHFDLSTGTLNRLAQMGGYR